MRDGQVTVAIALSNVDVEKLAACARLRRMTVEDVLRFYVRDWIATDYPASQGRFSRRQVYRDHP